MLIYEWWTELNRGKLKKDYDENFGIQCVDIANSYAEHVLQFGKGVFYGVRYAKQIFTNYNKNLFIAEKNALTNYPPKGSLVIWDRGTAGHIAIVIKADSHNITVCEGNYDGKGSLRTHTYTNYNNVVGWLKPYRTVTGIPSGCGLCNFAHRYKEPKKLYSYDNFKGFNFNGDKVYISGTDSEYTQIRQTSNKNVDNYVIKKYLK